MYLPSYDFDLFDLPDFSPLQAQEFGAATSFRANDPTSFVDFSLNQLYGLLQPSATYPYPQRQFPVTFEDVPFLNFFQGGQSSREGARVFAEEDVKRRRAEMEEAEREYRRLHSINIRDILQGRTTRSGGTGPILGSKETITGGPAPEGGQRAADTIKGWLTGLPAGSGTFLIAVVVIILVVLFVRR